MRDLYKTDSDFCCNNEIMRCNVNGEEMYCSELRIANNDIPQGLYKAEVRSSDYNADWWATIEPRVCVNFCATLISDKPFEFKEKFEYNGKTDIYTRVESYGIEYDEDLL